MVVDRGRSSSSNGRFDIFESLTEFCRKVVFDETMREETTRAGSKLRVGALHEVRQRIGPVLEALLTSSEKSPERRDRRSDDELVSRQDLCRDAGREDITGKCRDQIVLDLLAPRLESPERQDGGVPLGFDLGS